MAVDSVHKKAAKDITRRAKEIAKAQDNVWKVASKAPMFCRVYKKTIDKAGGKKGKKGDKAETADVKRSVRLISGHAFGLAAAGAAQTIAREQQIDCQNLGIEFSRLNDKGTPVCQSQLTPGYKYMLEQYMCAYVQECVHTARNMLKALPPRVRLNRDIMKYACNEVNEQLFYASAVGPRQVFVVPLPKKNKPKEEFTPPTEEEQAEEEAADDAAAAAAAAEEEGN